MATRTWSWSTTTANMQGTTWQEYTLSGTALPSGAVITNVEYNILARVGNYSSGTSYNFQLYGIGIYNGPYTGASYSSSSATTMVGTVSAKTTTSTSSTESMPSSGYQSYSFQSGSAYVWRYSSSRTYCQLSGCDFANQSSTSAFNSNYVYAKVRLNTNFSGTTYIMGVSVTVTYSEASVTTPTGLTLTQNNNGTYTLSWNASTASGGSGSIYYRVWSITDGYEMQYSTSRTYTASIPADYSYYFEWRVTAHYSGVSSPSNVYIGYTFKPPSISGPSSITLSTTYAPSVTVSWPAATLSWTNGDISYQVYYRKNGGSYVNVGSTTSTSKTFTEAMLDGYGDDRDTFVFQVDAYGSNLTNNADGNHSSVSSGSPDSSSFTFYSPNTVAYRDSSGWQEAIVYYRDSSGWKECDAYYHDGTNWNLIKSKTS